VVTSAPLQTQREETVKRLVRERERHRPAQTSEQAELGTAPTAKNSLDHDSRTKEKRNWTLMGLVNRW